MATSAPPSPPVMSRLASLQPREIAFIIAASAGSLWIVPKMLRAISSYLFPQSVLPHVPPYPFLLLTCPCYSVLPGEPNTVLLATPRPSAATSPATVKDLESVREYDYIIIGTGTAGCVLANRLSKDPNVSVLAIEAGHSDVKQMFSRIPAAFARLYGTAADHDIWTTKQSECDDRAMQWPRGKMIGGCSSINAMIFNKGAPDDFNEWSRLGADGWDFDSIQPYMKKAEGFTPPKDPGAELTAEELSEHGRDGPWQTGYSFISPISNVFIEACAALGFPKVRDLNSSKGINGVARLQTFIDQEGQRSSAAVAYLTKDVVQRANLKIASGQTATRIIFDSSSSGKPRAVGVEMAGNATTSVRYLAKAKKEIIVSAGAIHTPQILKISGIGPSEELSKLNIPVIKDLAGVGANLVDHLYATLVFKCTRGWSVHYLNDPVKSLGDLVQWMRNGTGTMTSNIAECAAYCRTATRPDAPATLRNNDLSSGPTSADLEILTGAVSFINHGRFVAPTDDVSSTDTHITRIFGTDSGKQDYCSLGPIMLRPESRGHVTLTTSDPFTPPRVDANYLSTKHDIDMMLYGLRLSRDIARSEPFKQHFREWYWPWNLGSIDDMNDDTMLKHIRATSETIYHPMGTAKMGTGPDAVVDPKLKVHGIKGLRVADASVFPAPVGCHPCAPVIMVGEKAADLVLRSAHL